MLAGALALALVACGPAIADNGVHVSPGGPTAHEYVLPLDAARGQAAVGSNSTGGPGQAGSNGAVASATGSSALFGAGIVVARHVTVRHGGRTHPVTAPDSTPGTQPIPPAVQRLAHASTSGGSPWALIGIAAGVLLLGGAAGLGLRRRS